MTLIRAETRLSSPRLSTSTQTDSDEMLKLFGIEFFDSQFSDLAETVTSGHPYTESTELTITPRQNIPEEVFDESTEEQDLLGFLVNLVLSSAANQAQSSHQRDNEEVREELFATSSHDEVLEILQENELNHLVDDYWSFLKHRQEDLEEGERPDIILQSLQSWAWFMVDYVLVNNLPYARLRADFDGCARLIWRLSEGQFDRDVDNKHWGRGRGIAVLKFFPSGLNYFSMMSGPFAPEEQRLTLEGYLSHDKTKKTIDMFSERLLNADPLPQLRKPHS